MHPICFKAKARFVAKVDFPTPPFALEIASVNFVPRIGFLVNFFGASFFRDHLIYWHRVIQSEACLYYILFLRVFVIVFVTTDHQGDDQI